MRQFSPVVWFPTFAERAILIMQPLVTGPLFGEIRLARPVRPDPIRSKRPLGDLEAFGTNTAAFRSTATVFQAALFITTERVAGVREQRRSPWMLLLLRSQAA
jgi:hypothetical protein